MIITEEMQQAVESGVIVQRWLIWLSGRNTTTGLVEKVGFWTGEDVRSFDIDGETREYVGAGSLIGLPDQIYESGAVVQMQRLTFSLFSQEVQDIVGQYDTRLAPLEIRLALFDPRSGELLGTAPSFLGWVEEPNIKKNGDTATLTLSVASSSRAGTKTLASKKSPESLRKRSATDTGRDYADIAADVDVAWGGEQKKGYFI